MSISVSRKRSSSLLWTAVPIWLVVCSAQGQVVSNGNLDDLPLGTNPDCSVPAGAWQWPAQYDLDAICETSAEQLRIVPTSSFEVGAVGNSMAIDLDTTYQLHLPNLFNERILTAPGERIRVSFDIWLPTPGVGDPSIYVGADNGGAGYSARTDRGPELRWLADGAIRYTDDRGRQSVLISSSPFNVWQHVLLDIDLDEEEFDFLWGAGQGQPVPIAAGRPFRSPGVTAMDRFTIAHLGNPPMARAYIDNLSVTRLGGDCNSNGGADHVYFAAGTSNDCNVDSLPDECGVRLGRFLALQNLYGIRGRSTVLAFDPSSASVRAPAAGVLPIFASYRGITPGPIPETVWICEELTEQLYLLRIGPAAGVVYSVHLDRPIIELAYDPIARVLYGTTYSQLYTIDQSTGLTTFVMDLPDSGPWIALGYDFCTGQLVASGDTSNTLYFIDPTTRAIRGMPNAIGVLVGDIAVDPLDGTIYGIVVEGLLVSINRESGVFTLTTVVTGVFETPSGLAITHGEDCNGNAAPDSCDIDDGRSQDANADGVPDECGVDCGCTMPVITMSPLSEHICAGDSITLTVGATGSPAPMIQWRFQGISIPGETGNSLTLTGTAPADSGSYDVMVNNSCGATVSDAAIVVVFPSASADINGDGLVDGLDIAGFIEVMLLSPNGPPELGYCGADMNGDGSVSLADVAALMAALLGPP